MSTGPARGTSNTLTALAGFLLVAFHSSGSFGPLHARVEPSPAMRDGRPTLATSHPSAAISRDVLDQYCIGCHNERLKTAGLMLDRLDATNVASAAPQWEKVVRKLRSGAMPPAGLPRPDVQTYRALTASLETALDRAAAEHPNPGRPVVHRLNRAEYANAVRDLIGVEIDRGSLLPADDSGYGFDNIADVLSVSPGLMERYMVAAAKIGRMAIGDSTIRPAAATYKVSPMLLQNDRMSEDLPFGSRGGLAIRHQFPVDGEYELRVHLQHVTNSPFIRGLTRPHRLAVWLDRAVMKEFSVGGGAGQRTLDAQVEYESSVQAALHLRVAAKAGSHLVAVGFQKDAMAPEGIFQPAPPVASFEYASLRDTDPAIDRIDIVGPYDPRVPQDSPSRRMIFTCHPAAAAAKTPCARRILARLARRAYRRPVGEADVQVLMHFFDLGRRGGFDTGIEWALERILAGPDFLFRMERDPAASAPGTPHRVSDVELVSRLSFFLWSSIPDDELLSLAALGRLTQPGVLEQQVRRMLADGRSDALVTDFASQWLYLRNIRAVLPNPETYPEFDDSLREGFQRETELFFGSQLREDHGVVDLLTAGYTFVNERLARHYGIPGVYGSHFRRVTLPDDRRMGLLGQGSILTVTSYANRTSPVVRGKWLLENLLGAPPPPPPPNVPALKDTAAGGRLASVRERLEEHRRNPACAACHARMDPLGFALENFDGVGKWRDLSEAGAPIDASGTLPDGTAFNGPAQFRRALLGRRDEFVATVAEKLLTYALGRGLEYYDAPAVRAIVRDAAPDYRWSSIILGIVRSLPFQMRVVPADPQMTTAAQIRRSSQQ
jgi:hypothetical protein